jgi:uncharacterized delta-60 repeat protein
MAQPDGKIIIGGEFSTVRGAARNGIARLNTDGTVDRTFDPGMSMVSIKVTTYASVYGDHLVVVTNIIIGTVRAIAQQPDGRLLIGRNFNPINGASVNELVRLNPDGSLDASVGVGSVFALALQPDGRVLLGGDFTHFNNLRRAPVARLLGDSPVLVFGPVCDTDTLVAQFRGILGLTYTIEYRENLASGTWQKLGNVTAHETDLAPGEGVFELRDDMDPVGCRFYRVVQPAY